MQKIFQLVVLSGKGGVGKTNIAADLAYHAANAEEIPGAVMVDADVDAANMSLLLNPRMSQSTDYYGGKIAKIAPDQCAGCGICEEVCRYDAVLQNDDGEYSISQPDCEGCAACFYACPEQAIRMEPHQDGIWAKSYTRFGPLLHAELFPGKDNSGKLVSLVRQQAKFSAEEHRFPLIIIDGPPGTGCPVIAASTGVDLGLLVTEPSVAGLHDLKRIHATLKHFHIQTLLCINKVGLNPAVKAEIEAYAAAEKMPIVGEIPFERVVPQAMVNGQVVQEFDENSQAAAALKQMWQNLTPFIFGE